MQQSEPPPYQSYNAQDGASGPPLPPRAAGDHIDSAKTSQQPVANNQNLYPAPPQRSGSHLRSGSDVSSPVHYTRDPHKLVAYLVPLPKPALNDLATPPRFLIYTPPPPPLKAPKEGDKEGKAHKLQRKWEEEVREAKTSTAKTASWKGLKSKATRGINVAMSYTKTSNLEFVNRMGGSGEDTSDKHADDGHHEGDETHRTVGLEEIVLVYPASINSSPQELREEFVESLMRTKSKAQKDAVLATGLLPVSLAIDVLCTVIWPFGGLLEIDGVWAAASIKGAKTSRSVTKRLSSSSKTGKHDEDTLQLSFTPSPRLEILENYLAAKCHDRDAKMFPSKTTPVETDVLEAIGWSPSHSGEEKNWEDEQWETTEVKDDLRMVMTKAAKEWDKWVKLYAKDPEKAAKK